MDPFLKVVQDPSKVNLAVEVETFKAFIRAPSRSLLIAAK
jgi:hypothetical protein